MNHLTIEQVTAQRDLARAERDVARAALEKIIHYPPFAHECQSMKDARRIAFDAWKDGGEW